MGIGNKISNILHMDDRVTLGETSNFPPVNHKKLHENGGGLLVTLMQH